MQPGSGPQPRTGIKAVGLVADDRDGRLLWISEMNDIWDRKSPTFGIVMVSSAIATFFIYNDIKKYLDNLILVNIEGSLLKAITQTAIMLSCFWLPMLLALLLTKSKYGIFQIIGMFFGGIGLGVLLRITLSFARFLYPYG